MSKLQIFRGDTPKGTVNLFTQDPNSGISIAYPIPTGATIEMYFPGETASVVLSTAVVGEITILSAPDGQIAYAMSSAKSLLLKLGDNQPADVVVSTLAGDIYTAERVKVLKIMDRANP